MGGGAGRPGWRGVRLRSHGLEGSHMSMATRLSRLRLDEVLREVVQRQSEVLAEAVRQAHPDAGAVGVRLDDAGAVVGTDDPALVARERGMAGVPPSLGLAA